MQYVDLTPRWTEILPNWLLMYREAIRGNVNNPDKIVDNADYEFERMAQGADNFNDLVAYLRKEGWKDDRLKQALTIGRELQEIKRNTIKESQNVM